MNLRKNAGAKIGALMASVGALGGILVLVHQNPPPTAADATTTSGPTPAATPQTSRASQPAPSVRHTRTRAS